MCYQRSTDEAVEGCEFPNNDQRYIGMDVCVEDPDYEAETPVPSFSPAPSIAPEPTIAPTAPQPTQAPTPIGSNSWSQTWGMSDPFKFLGPPSTAAPTTKEEKALDYSWIFDFTDPQPLQYVGNNGKFDDSYRGALGPCQADCDKDIDCAGPLECFQRKGNETVPGCLGQDNSDEDYCVWPEGYNATEGYSEMLEENAVPNPYDSGFCLKLYW